MKEKQWYRIVSAMAAVAVFFTTYAMILPAITWERSLVCEIPEHSHEDACYETVTVPAEKELACETDEHQHGPECYEQVLICDIEESEGHTHCEACFNEAGELVCDMEESEGHIHSEACYCQELVCRTQEHAHTDECYETVGEEHVEQILVCQLEEHEHTEACFDAPPAEEDGYYCGKIEHTHSEEQYCYFSDGSLRCTIPEHVHTLACKSNPNADVENEANCRSSFAGVALSGNWADDVIAVAKTQIGYAESTRNYEVQEDGSSIKGYTRYGDWYGNTYGDWCAMFCSFCLNYAGIDREMMPIEASCGRWVEILTEKEMFRESIYYKGAKDGTAEYRPKPGDLIFFDWDGVSDSDHVGLVYEVSKDENDKVIEIRTIEGNNGNTVACYTYEFADDSIMGYGELPENPNLKKVAESENDEERPYAEIEIVTEDGVTVTVTGSLPEGAEIRLSEVPEEVLAEILEQVEANAPVFAYDITIIDAEGNEWQPDELGVTVSISGLAMPQSKIEVVHVPDEGGPEQVEAQQNEDAIVFTAGGFSIYVGYTVDFQNNSLCYSIGSDGNELLSVIFEQLGITESISDITAVTSSDQNKLAVEAVSNDWRVTALSSFTSELSLNVTFEDTHTIVIPVSVTAIYDMTLTPKQTRLKLNVYDWVTGEPLTGVHISVDVYNGASVVSRGALAVISDDFGVAYGSLPYSAISSVSTVRLVCQPVPGTGYVSDTSIDGRVRVFVSGSNTTRVATTGAGKPDNIEVNKSLTKSAGSAVEMDIYVKPDPSAVKSVWAYHAGSVGSYYSFDTVEQALASSLSRDGDLFEFHDDVVETNTAAVTVNKSVTIRSEVGADHSWSFSSLRSGAYGLLINNKNVVIGGESGYGTITVGTKSGSGFIQIRGGELTLNDGLVVQNCSITAKNGVIRMDHESAGTTPVVHVNGGLYQNNTSSRGAVITNVNGILYLNGGTFADNSTTYVAMVGDKNAVYNKNTMYIGGNPELIDGQCIFLPGDKTRDTDSGNCYSMVKAAEITSNHVIPVFVGTSTANLYEYRNVLTSGNDSPVLEGDLEKFVLTNEEDVTYQYMKLGYTAAENGTGSPVLELLNDDTHFFDFVIDYEVTPESPTAGKTAAWLDADKEEAEIVIEEKQSELPVLFLGSLCPGHGLTKANLISAINHIAVNADVEYYLGGYISNGAASGQGALHGDVRGSIAKGSAMTTAQKNEFSLASGAHVSGLLYAQEIVNKLETGSYSRIVFLFDNSSIWLEAYTCFPREDQSTFYKAAKLLEQYYKNRAVVWITSLHGNDEHYDDANPPETTGALLSQGGYRSDFSLIHYSDETLIDSSKYNAYYAFFTMALFDPTTWLNAVENSTIPAWSDYSINTYGMYYNNVASLTTMIDSMFDFDSITIIDEVVPELPVTDVTAEYSDDDRITWNQIPVGSGALNVTGQSVSYTLTDKTYFAEKLRLRIRCSCPGELTDGNHHAGNTNVGDAVIEYRINGLLTTEIHLVTPTLYKEGVTLTITKRTGDSDTSNQYSFELEVINADDSTPDLSGIVWPSGVTLKNATTNVLSFALSKDDSVEFENLLPQGAKLTLTEISHGGYVVTMDTSMAHYNGNSQSFVLNDDLTITVTNTTGYMLPDTGGIGVYPIYALGALLVAGSIMTGYILRRKRERWAE